jgi:hypothetical protein
MHTPHASLPLSRRPAHALRRLALLTATASALLAACGGGGGGGSSSSTSPTTSPDTTSTATAVAASFPYGVALGSPTALVQSSSVVTGSTLASLGLSTTMAPQQALASGLSDAVASGRLSLTGNALVSVSELFDTSLPGQASCYGPAVAYLNHDDAPGSNGTLAAGTVAMWADSDNSATPVPCAAAQLNARTQVLSAQTRQAMLLLGGLRLIVASDSSLSSLTAGTSIDLLSRISPVLSTLLSGVTVNAASVSVNADASEYSYRLVLTRGSGASAQSIELNLLHTPADTDTHFAGVLQITLGYLSTDASLGCSDQRDSASRYKVARLSTLGYNRQDNLLSLRARTGVYCGNPALSASSHLQELAATTLSGELDPAVFVNGSTRGSTLGWRQGFARLSSDVALSDLSSDFVYAWQDQPLGGASHARLFAGHSTQDATTQTRTLALFHGYTDDISTTDGTLQGMVCNDGGPGSMHTMNALFQYQQLTLGASASHWTLGTSAIRYAPTNSCNASATMSFDLNGTGGVISGEGASFSNTLHGLSGGSLDVQDELIQQGFWSPTLLL